MCKISIIIPVKNEAEKIERCLEAVFDQTVQPFEVIVVDGHSTDKTVENAKKFPIRIFYEDYHTRGGACQVGVENVKGDYVAFTDADCIPKRNWLENLIKEFDEDVVGVGGGIINIGEHLGEKSIAFALDTFLGSANSVQGRLFKDKRYVTTISGCNRMHRREDIIEVGGFDVVLPTDEDTELDKKLLKIGKLLYTPDAVVLHNHQRGLKEFAKRMYQYGYGRAESRLWGLQVVAPVVGLIALLLLFVSPKAFLVVIFIYALVLLCVGFKIFIKARKAQYLVLIPIVLIMEHISYSAGFWIGVIKSLVGRV
ncbi:MAG: glycosyltransferase [Methanophagales archaeon]|nr:glycosyltransferase [Methanophagales archaeon]